MQPRRETLTHPFGTRKMRMAVTQSPTLLVSARRNASTDHGALTICLHAGGNPASVKGGLGLLGGGCSVDSLNQ
jgi:hypothetical protein